MNSIATKSDKSFDSSKQPQIFQYTIASKTRRFCAFLVNILVTFMVLFLLNYTLYGDNFYTFLETPTDVYSVLLSSIISFILGTLYYPFFSGNIGHKIFNLKVIDANTGEDFSNFFEGGLREFMKNFLSNFIIPIIWLFFDVNYQNIYDKIAKTYVVLNKKK